MKIDAHTHHEGPHPALVMGKQAIGIHPWEVQKEISLRELRLKFDKQLSEHPNLMAIGECGLDRSRADLLSIEDQITVLEWHLDVAKIKNLPVIIHCVRSHSDLIGLFIKVRMNQTFMLHDFNGNEFQINEYLKFNPFFSLGKRGIKHLKKIPPNRLLLETDDQREISLDELYAKASLELGLSSQQLEKQLEENFLAFFSQSHDVSSANFIKNFGR